MTTSRVAGLPRAPRVKNERLRAEVAALTAAVTAEQLRREYATGQHEPRAAVLPAVEPMPWAARLLAAVDGPVPEYGSPEWEELADTDRRKAAAAVVAAERWRVYWSPEQHAARLRDELAAARHIAAEEEAAGWAEVAAGLPSPPLTRPAPRFTDPRPLAQSDDWPAVRFPPAAGGQLVPRT